MTGPGVACKTASAFAWRLIEPRGCAEADRSVLREISEFRGRILYAEGRRPSFRLKDGSYRDDDPLDSRSFHVTARASGDLIGYIRIRRIPECSQSTLGTLITEPEFEGILKGMRLIQEDCLEVSRWVVAPSARGTEVAATLVVSAWAIGRWIRKRCLLATVGARDGQMAMLARFGGQVLRNVNAKFIAEYDDQVVAMHFDLNDPPPRVATKLRKVARLLKLPETISDNASRMDTCFDQKACVLFPRSI